MESLVGVVNKLQDVFTTLGSDPIQLPQVIVVGTQSSGKSSVLESIVGRSFLPRGTGVITRRPLILQLVQCLQSDPRRTESLTGDWGIFLHEPTKMYTDFNDIHKEILTETERKAGVNKGICTEPIVLKIFSDKVLSLTLVDLPGITRVPVGDQPPDIEVKIRELIIRYTRNPNSVILAVVTANTDMETNESLQLAREVDPSGQRTLAVVTKLDLMDAGTDALDILEGRVVPVKLGIVGVVNRSQKDINNGVTIQESLRNEGIFLHKNYPSIASKHGTRFLAKSLQAILMRHIKACLPELRQKVNSNLARYQNELVTLGREIECPKQGLLDILTNFSAAYISAIEGTRLDVGTHDLEGGARIGYIFHETFTKTLNSLDPLQGFDRTAILTAMRNASGTKPTLFIPELCFELIAKKQIARLLDPALCCIHLVQEELERVLDNCGLEIHLELSRFPKLRLRIVEVLGDLIRSRVAATTELVNVLIMIHTSYVNTAHPDFMADTMKLQAHFEITEPKTCESRHPQRSIAMRTESRMQCHIDESSRVLRDCVFIEKLIISYYNIVRKIVSDTVPKAIMHSMVQYVMSHLLSELVSKIYSQDKSLQLLEENIALSSQRDRTKKMIEALRKADSIINEVKEIKF